MSDISILRDDPVTFEVVRGGLSPRLKRAVGVCDRCAMVDGMGGGAGARASEIEPQGLQWIPTRFPIGFNGHPEDLTRNFNGFLQVFQKAAVDSSKGFLKMSMDSQRISNGFTMDFQWISNGIKMDLQ